MQWRSFPTVIITWYFGFSFLNIKSCGFLFVFTISSWLHLSVCLTSSFAQHCFFYSGLFPLRLNFCNMSRVHGLETFLVFLHWKKSLLVCCGCHDKFSHIEGLAPTEFISDSPEARHPKSRCWCGLPGSWGQSSSLWPRLSH